MCITRIDLEIIFKTDLLEGIQQILSKYINKDSCAYRAFNQKGNKIYIFTKTDNWIICHLLNLEKYFL